MSLQKMTSTFPLYLLTFPSIHKSFILTLYMESLMHFSYCVCLSPKSQCDLSSHVFQSMFLLYLFKQPASTTNVFLIRSWPLYDTIYSSITFFFSLSCSFPSGLFFWRRIVCDYSHHSHQLCLDSSCLYHFHKLYLSWQLSESLAYTWQC